MGLWLAGRMRAKYPFPEMVRSGQSQAFEAPFLRGPDGGVHPLDRLIAAAQMYGYRYGLKVHVKRIVVPGENRLDPAAARRAVLLQFEPEGSDVVLDQVFINDAPVLTLPRCPRCGHWCPGIGCACCNGSGT